jgi:hypothetical protein
VKGNAKGIAPYGIPKIKKRKFRGKLAVTAHPSSASISSLAPGKRGKNIFYYLAPSEALE